jgi:hypothetical protein
MKEYTSSNVDVLNASRFKAQASTILKLASKNGKSEGINPELYSQLSACVNHLSSKNDIDSKDIRKLMHECEVRESEAIVIESSKEGLNANDGNNVSTKIRKSKLRAPKPNETNASSIAIQDDENNNDNDDTTSGEKIHSLLQQSRNIASQELEHEQSKHNELVSEMGELVGSLKDAALLMNKLVVQQNVELDEIAVVATENTTELEGQREKMKEQTKSMSKSVWTTVGTVIWLLVWFAVTYLVMRLFPSPSH